MQQCVGPLWLVRMNLQFKCAPFYISHSSFPLFSLLYSALIIAVAKKDVHGGRVNTAVFNIGKYLKDNNYWDCPPSTPPPATLPPMASPSPWLPLPATAPAILSTSIYWVLKRSSESHLFSVVIQFASHFSVNFVCFENIIFANHSKTAVQWYLFWERELAMILGVHCLYPISSSSSSFSFLAAAAEPHVGWILLNPLCGFLFNCYVS